MSDPLFERDMRIAKMRREGSSLNEIARAVGLTQSGVSHVIKRLRLAKPPNPRDLEADAKVTAERAAGKSLREIADEMGVDIRVVRKRANKLQLPDPYAGTVRPRRFFGRSTS